MKSIFTYPNNASDHFIDPNYVGDNTEGLQKRVKDMKDGNYKTLTNGSSIGTVDQLMEGLSKFNNNPLLEEDSGNNTIYKLWEQPILEGSMDLSSTQFSISGVGSSTKTEYTVNFDSSGDHGFAEGQKVRLTNDGTTSGTNNRTGTGVDDIGNQELYVKKIDANTIQLATDSGLSNLIKFYGRESATISSVTEASLAVFTDSGGHDLTVGTEVTLSGANGYMSNFNGQTFYVNSISGNDFTLSFDSSLNNDFGFQSQQTPNAEKFDFNITDNDITIGIDDAVKYTDGANFRLNTSNVEDLSYLDTNISGVGNLTPATTATEAHSNYTGTNAQWAALNSFEDMSVSKDGSRLGIVYQIPFQDGGAGHQQKARIYSHSNGTFTLLQTIDMSSIGTPGSSADYSSAFSSDGNTFVVGHPGRGATDTTYGGANITVLQQSSNTYSVQQTISYDNDANTGTTNDFESFGTYTDLSDDGLKLITSDRYAANGVGRTFLYTRSDTSSNFSLHTTITDSTCVGGRVRISGDGNTFMTQHLAANGTTTGVTKIFKNISGTYTNVYTVSNSADSSGIFNVFDISPNGNEFIIGQANTSINYFQLQGYSGSGPANYVHKHSLTTLPGGYHTPNHCSFSSNMEVFTIDEYIFDIIDNAGAGTSTIKLRHRVTNASNSPRIKFGGSSEDQDMYIPEFNRGSAPMDGTDKIYRIAGNDDQYRIIAWLHQYNTDGTLSANTQQMFMKYVSASGGRYFYKLYSDAGLQNELGFTSDDRLAGKFTTTKDLTFTFPTVIGLSDFDDTTAGSILETLPTQGSNIIPVLNIASNNTGSSKITISDNETYRYRLTGIQMTHGGQGVTFLQRTGASTYVNNAELPQQFIKAGSDGSTVTTFGTWPTGLTVGTNSSGYITSFTGFDTEFPGYFLHQDDIMFAPRTVADTYSAPAASLASQEDVFDMDTEWDTLGYNADKQWPDNVLPQSAVVTYNQPNQTTVSQTGTKYVRNSGVNKWQVDLVYPPMTEDDFRTFHSRVQKAKGQLTPFHLNIKKDSTSWLFKFNDLTYNTVRIKDTLATGGTQVLLEGFTTGNVLKEGSLAIAGTTDNGNIHTVTNQPTANKYGEVKVRLAYPTQSTLNSGDLFYMKPSHVVVTLAEDGFEYSVDTAGRYLMSVKFDLDEWKA